MSSFFFSNRTKTRARIIAIEASGKNRKVWSESAPHNRVTGIQAKIREEISRETRNERIDRAEET